ncbi:MAG: Mannose-6-phosphate isomerase [Candidatus Parcubacteria bacterium]|jgi:mannose-6-phosphate isomerase-like protein (cupin superfamily)
MAHTMIHQDGFVEGDPKIEDRKIIRTISIHPGVTTPKHVQYTTHESLRVLDGTGVIRLGDSEIKVSKGSKVEIPAGTVHSISNHRQDDPLELSEIPILTIQQTKEFKGARSDFELVE